MNNARPGSEPSGPQQVFWKTTAYSLLPHETTP